MKSKLLATMMLTIMMGASFSAIAAPDEAQRHAIQQAINAKEKLQQAKAAKGQEQKNLMADHMKMMQEIMDKMMAMKPKSGMSMEEHEGWINEHQKLMQQVMDQMLDEHQLLMKDCDGMAR